MLITKSKLDKFNNVHKKVIEIMKLSDRTFLNGSFDKTLWASDIDLYEKINVDKLDNVIYSLIKNIVNLEENFHFVKLKVGNKKIYDKIKALYLLDDPKKLKKILFDKKNSFNWIKWDLLVYNGVYIEEISMIYDFTIKNVTKSQIIKLIKDDIKEYTENKKLFKVMKRLNKVNPSNQDIIRILENPELGFIYLTLSRINGLLESSFNKNIKDNVLSNIKEDIIIKIGARNPKYRKIKDITSLKQLEKIKNQLQSDLNSKINHLLLL